MIVNAHAAVHVFGETRCFNVDLSLYLHPYFVFASREGSGELDSSEPSVLTDANSTIILCTEPYSLCDKQQGAQWLSGRVLDSRPEGRGFEPHRRHCVVVLEQDIFILA